MLIEGKKYQINLLILLMEKDVDVTVQTIETLLQDIDEGVVISVLMNGGKSDKLKGFLDNVDSVNYYESETNLGVAGGRNYLFETEECKKSDIIMILDNDVVTPYDYINSLANFLIQNEDCGVAGAIALDINNISYNIARHFGAKGGFGNKIFKISCQDMKRDLLRDLTPYRLFHIGVHPNYYLAYFSILSFFFNILSTLLCYIRICRSFDPILNFNSNYHNKIKKGDIKYAVSNVAGCSQAFRRKLLNEIGPLNNMFNPYAFEDSDFCIRAIKAGYKNYIHTNTLLYHGTIPVEKEDNNKTIKNSYRGLTILASQVYPGKIRYKLVIVKLLIFKLIFELFPRFFIAFMNFKDRCGGFLLGIKQINENKS